MMKPINSLTVPERLERLKELRDLGIRKSYEVIKLVERPREEGDGIEGGSSLSDTENDRELHDYYFGLSSPSSSSSGKDEDSKNYRFDPAIVNDNIWNVYEQVTIAALDIGRIELAKSAIKKLETKFPDSIRVLILKGMLLESRGELDLARQFYEDQLNGSNPKSNGSNSKPSDDNLGESNIRIRKRLIALHLNQKSSTIKSDSKSSNSDGLSFETGIKLLVELLDSIYTDPEGWLQLAEAYSSIGSYQQSLAALEDLILIQPDNTFHLLRYAETAYTAGEIELAYKTYLRIIELSGPISDELKGGPCRRASLGARLCIERLPTTEKSKMIKDIISRELNDCYSQDWVPFHVGLRVASENCRKVLKAWIES